MSQSRDHAVIIRVDNLTSNEEKKFAAGVVKLKQKVAPDGRASMVQGKTKELPGKVRTIALPKE